MVRPDCSHCLEHFKGKSKTIFQTTSVFIGPLVVQGGEKHGEKVAVGTVQFQPVKPCLLRTFTGSDKIRFDLLHVLTCHFPWNLVFSRIGNRRGTDQRPVTTFKGLVDAVPHPFCRTLRTCMSDLDRHFCRGIVMDKINNPFPCVCLFV